MLQDLQAQVDERIQTIWVTYFEEMTNCGILTEEVGEVARIMAREYGEQSWKKWSKPENVTHALWDELADVLFVLTAIANQTWVNLEEARERWMQKRSWRDAQRHSDNEKLTRKI